MQEQMTLGEMISALQKCDQDATVRFDFGGLHPASMDSYRGYYDQLAIGFESNLTGSNTGKVGWLLEQCQFSIEHVFHGYKGGEYQMSLDTPLWVANYGQCHGTAVVGVRDLGYMVIIETAYLDN